MQNTSAPVLIASGLTVCQWHPGQGELGTQARNFCLATIKDTYGYDYRPDWHADLDSLTSLESWYDPALGGTFLIIRDEKNEVVGTAGIYPINRKPGLKAELGENRYTDWNAVAALGRTYLHPAYRGNGLSRVVVGMLEHAAHQLGYTYLNLHCEESAVRLRGHWESLGFTNILNDDNTSHYDKIVHNSEISELRAVA